MLSLKRPFKNEKNIEDMRENVWAPWGPKLRPPIPIKLHHNIQQILHASWNHDYRARPRAPQLLESLKSECLFLCEDMRVCHARRRSTYILDHNDRENYNHTLEILMTQLLAE